MKNGGVWSDYWDVALMEFAFEVAREFVCDTSITTKELNTKIQNGYNNTDMIYDPLKDKTAFADKTLYENLSFSIITVQRGFNLKRIDIGYCRANLFWDTRSLPYSVKLTFVLLIFLNNYFYFFLTSK
jgi:hypothetical protein